MRTYVGSILFEAFEIKADCWHYVALVVSTGNLNLKLNATLIISVDI